MPELETFELVVNTGPLIALSAGVGDLCLLQMYRRVLVPQEVADELQAGQAKSPWTVEPFTRAHWLEKQASAAIVPQWLASSLDRGEAAVIQTALQTGVGTVCIDEIAGRYMAQLAGLRVTGSVGVLLRAKRCGRIQRLRPILENMQKHGIWLSQELIARALTMAGE